MRDLDLARLRKECQKHAVDLTGGVCQTHA
jgi:hypothetical protein